MLELSSGIVSGKEVSLGEDTHCTCKQNNASRGALGERVAGHGLSVRLGLTASSPSSGLEGAPGVPLGNGAGGALGCGEVAPGALGAASKKELAEGGHGGLGSEWPKPKMSSLGDLPARRGQMKHVQARPRLLRHRIDSSWAGPWPGLEATTLLTAEEDVAGLRGLVRAGVQGLVPQWPCLGLDERLEHGAVRVAVLPQPLP